MRTWAMVLAMVVIGAQVASAEVSEKELKSIQTPDKVKTSSGTLEFLHGAPSAATAEKVYDYLDRMRGVDAFLKDHRT